MADLENWPRRLENVIQKETGGNVSAFARRVTEALKDTLPDVTVTREVLRNYLEKGSEAGFFKGCAIAVVTGRNPLWLAFGIGPERLPEGLLGGMMGSRAQPDTELLMIPYYRIRGGRLEQDQTAHPFGLVRQFLPSGTRTSWLIALEIPMEVENPRLAITSGGVSVAELYDEEGVAFDEAARQDDGLRSGDYLVRTGDRFQFLRISEMTVQGRYDVRDHGPQVETSGGLALNGSPEELAHLRIYARVVASWQHRRN
jgi:hypothetical protein